MKNFKPGDKVVWNYETADVIPRKVPAPATIVGRFHSCGDGFYTITIDANGKQQVLHESWLELVGS